MRKTKHCLSVAAVFLGFVICWGLSCESQNEEDLFGEVCDTVGISFTADVVPILSKRCYHCHYEGTTVPNVPFSLQGYENVLTRVNTGQLEPAINHTGPFKMPLDGPKLPECELATINIWIRDGAPDN